MPEVPFAEKQAAEVTVVGGLPQAMALRLALWAEYLRVVGVFEFD
jgi:hypothetical protein